MANHTSYNDNTDQTTHLVGDPADCEIAVPQNGLLPLNVLHLMVCYGHFSSTDPYRSTYTVYKSDSLLAILGDISGIGGDDTQQLYILCGECPRGLAARVAAQGTKGFRQCQVGQAAGHAVGVRADRPEGRVRKGFAFDSCGWL